MNDQRIQFCDGGPQAHAVAQVDSVHPKTANRRRARTLDDAELSAPGIYRRRRYLPISAKDANHDDDDATTGYTGPPFAIVTAWLSQRTERVTPLRANVLSILTRVRDERARHQDLRKSLMDTQANLCDLLQIRNKTSSEMDLVKRLRIQSQAKDDLFTKHEQSLEDLEDKLEEADRLYQHCEESTFAALSRLGSGAELIYVRDSPVSRGVSAWSRDDGQSRDPEDSNCQISLLRINENADALPSLTNAERPAPWSTIEASGTLPPLSQPKTYTGGIGAQMNSPAMDLLFDEPAVSIPEASPIERVEWLQDHRETIVPTSIPHSQAQGCRGSSLTSEKAATQLPIPNLPPDSLSLATPPDAAEIHASLDDIVSHVDGGESEYSYEPIDAFVLLRHERMYLNSGQSQTGTQAFSGPPNKPHQTRRRMLDWMCSLVVSTLPAKLLYQTAYERSKTLLPQQVSDDFSEWVRVQFSEDKRDSVFEWDRDLDRDDDFDDGYSYHDDGYDSDYDSEDSVQLQDGQYSSSLPSEYFTARATDSVIDDSRDSKHASLRSEYGD